MRSTIKYSFLYAVLVSALSFSFYSIFQITPTGDDYWYSALLKEYGFIGGMSVFLTDFSGFFFKELLSFLIISPITYLPIGIGSGVSFLLLALISTLLILILVRSLVSSFWQGSSLNDKLILFLSTLLFNLLVNTMWYRNQVGHFFGGLEDQVYDLTFWMSMQVNYIAVTSVLFIWYVLLQIKQRKDKFYYTSVLLFGLALGTSHYILTAIFWSLLILIFVLGKIGHKGFKLKDSVLFFVSSLLGVLLTFAFPGNIKRMTEATAGNNSFEYGDPTKNYFLDIAGYNISYYFGNLLNPSLIIMSLFIIIIVIIISKGKEYSTTNLYRLGLILLVVAFVGYIIAYIIDHITVHYAWHYNHSVFLIRVAFLVLSIHLGVQLSYRLKNNLIKIPLIFAVIGCIYLPLINQNTVIESRMDCWYAGDCRVGNAPEIDTYWFYEQWLTWKKYTELPERVSSLDEFI
jgi:hypothetical protein